MIHEKGSNLSSYTTGLLASGRLVFRREEAQKANRMGAGAFLDAAEKLQKRGRLFSPRRGFYVVVPPQYLNLGSPPPASFIDDLMRFEGHSYYVGLLKAAELHGAAHQAVMEFQVVTDKRLPIIRAGRTKIVFYYRKDLSRVAGGIEDRKTESGMMKLSGAELTVLDLLRYPQAGGGIDNIVTIMGELGEKLDPEKLAALSSAFERAVVQRLGYLLHWLRLRDHADRLHEALEKRSMQWVELDPALAIDPETTPSPVTQDRRWRVTVRRAPERDL
jgi:predicted transcriptional regulator of viral defense system